MVTCRGSLTSIQSSSLISLLMISQIYLVCTQRYEKFNYLHSLADVELLERANKEDWLAFSLWSQGSTRVSAPTGNKVAFMI